MSSKSLFRIAFLSATLSCLTYFLDNKNIYGFFSGLTVTFSFAYIASLMFNFVRKN